MSLGRVPVTRERRVPNYPPVHWMYKHMSEQVHPLLPLSLLRGECPSQKHIPAGRRRLRPHGISPLTWFPADDGESKPWRAASRGG
jgi:hypothetical protein